MTICTVNTISNMYPEEVFVNNHIDLVIDFHESTEFTGARIVGVQVSALAPLCPSSCFPPSLNPMHGLFFLSCTIQAAKEARTHTVDQLSITRSRLGVSTTSRTRRWTAGTKWTPSRSS
jgi:hypothetical protein